MRKLNLYNQRTIQSKATDMYVLVVAPKMIMKLKAIKIVKKLRT
jgi:hypothetical protein